MEAIMASLANPNSGANSKEQDDEERRILLEVMQLSKLEEEKNKGNLNLDFLKRGKKKAAAEKSDLRLNE